MFDESIITIVFRLLNFAALIGLFVFLYRRYFKHEIEQDIERERLDQINIHETIKQLDIRSQELTGTIIDQENLCKQLIVRTTEWKQAWDKDAIKQYDDKQLLERKTLERAQKQQAMIKERKIAQDVLSQAIEHARQELIAHFAQPKNGQLFIVDILAMMEKSI